MDFRTVVVVAKYVAFYGLLLKALSIIMPLEFLPINATFLGHVPESFLKATQYPTLRVQRASVAVLHVASFVSLAALLWRPSRRIAAAWMALSVPVAFYVFDALSGQWVGGDLELLGLIGGTVLLVPGPRSLLAPPEVDRRTAQLVAAAAIAWLGFALTQLMTQRVQHAVHPEAYFQGWSWMATYALLLPIWGLLGATDHEGWQLPAWSAVIASAAYGAQSLAFPETLSAAGPAAAIACILWAAAYAGLIVKRTQRVD